MIFFLNILLLICVVFLLHKYFRGPLASKWFFTVLTLKIIGGLALGWVYTYFYQGGDTFNFFHNAVLLNQGFTETSFINQPRTEAFIMILQPIAWITDGNYWLSAIYFSIISFLGIWWLIRVIHQHWPEYTISAVISFGMIPSVVFWTSGIIKDSLSLSAACLIAASLIHINREKKQSILEWLAVVISLILLYFIKHYLFVVSSLIYLSGVILATTKNLKNRFLFRVFIFIGLFVTAFLSVRYVHPYFDPNRLPLTIKENYEAIAVKSSQENMIKLNLEPTWTSLFINAPKALVCGLFLPSVIDPGDKLGWAAALENLLLLFLSMVAMIEFIRTRPSPTYLLLLTLLFILILGSILPLSTPNFGSLSRYRTSYLPFLYFILFTGATRFPVFRKWLSW